ncbi:MAG: glycosyltransferase family 4 protein [PVC group bacterium]
MNILALVPDRNAPSCRFRVDQFVRPLAGEGISLEIVELGRGGEDRRKSLKAAADFDGVVLHRKLLNRSDFRTLRRLARRLIYDFDDAVMFRDSNARRLESRMRRRKFQRLVSGADLVIAGNEYLRRWAAPHCHKVAVIPTAVDLSPFPPAPVGGTGGTIGWMGTGSNFVYLSLVESVLESLIRSRPGVSFQVVSDAKPVFRGLPAGVKKWSRDEEVPDLTGFDIGIMPLLDDPWAAGKCALKILQYSAAFLPVVCSPVGANREVIRDGVNGYFARVPSEWRRRLEDLLDSAERREEMGRAGRKIVEEGYSVSVMAPRLCRALREAVG